MLCEITLPISESKLRWMNMPTPQSMNSSQSAEPFFSRKDAAVQASCAVRETHRHGSLQGLRHDTVPFGEFEEFLQLLGGRTRFEGDFQADLLETNRCIFGNAQGSSKIQIPFSTQDTFLNRNSQRICDG